jgi:hypothetical protein
MMRFIAVIVRPAPPARLGDPHSCHFDGVPPHDDALGRCGRQPGMHDVGHLLDGEAIRRKDRLGAALGARGERLEGGGTSRASFL